MPRTCTICAHAGRDAIDAALVTGAAFPAIAALYRVSEDALGRHKASHVPATLAQAAEASEVARADSLLDQLRDLQATTLRILATAEKTGRLTPAVLAIGQARQNIELMAKLLGELDQEGTTNITISPQYVEVRTLIITALAAFPEARQAVVAALAAGEAHDD